MNHAAKACSAANSAARWHASQTRARHERLTSITFLRLRNSLPTRMARATSILLLRPCFTTPSNAGCREEFNCLWLR